MDCKKVNTLKKHSTNYYNTFIEIAEDCPVDLAEIPPHKGDQKSVANRQFDLLEKSPYKYTSDDVLFQVYADKNDFLENEYANERTTFFSKGQPCFRASPLTKRYGFGVHNNAEGKMAIYGAGTPEYQSFLNDPTLERVKAMRSKKKS